MIKKRFQQLVMLVAVLFPALSALAQSETVVSLSGNAYVTAAKSGKV